MCSKHVEAWNKTYCETKILCIKLVKYWDKYTAMHGQQNVKKKNYMFRTDLLSIIRSPNTVYTAIGICHTSYVGCLLANSQHSLAFIIGIYNDVRSSECHKQVHRMTGIWITFTHYSTAFLALISTAHNLFDLFVSITSLEVCYNMKPPTLQFWPKHRCLLTSDFQTAS